MLGEKSAAEVGHDEWRESHETVDEGERWVMCVKDLVVEGWDLDGLFLLGDEGNELSVF